MINEEIVTMLLELLDLVNKLNRKVESLDCEITKISEMLEDNL